MVNYIFVFMTGACIALLLGILGLVVLPDKYQDVWYKSTLGICLICVILAVVAFMYSCLSV